MAAVFAVHEPVGCELSGRTARSLTRKTDGRRPGQPHDRGHAGQRARGHLDPRGRQAGRRARAALLLPPGAARAPACAACAWSKWRRRPSSSRRAPPRWPRGRWCTSTVRQGARRRAKGVLEMLLINHPLDCPICDQAGECELQDYTFQEGRAGTRYRSTPSASIRSRTSAATSSTSPTAASSARAASASWTTSPHDPVLNVSERGDRAFIGKFEEQRPRRIRGPATSSTSARSARCSRRTS